MSLIENKSPPEATQDSQQGFLDLGLPEFPVVEQPSLMPEMPVLPTPEAKQPDSDPKPEFEALVPLPRAAEPAEQTPIADGSSSSPALAVNSMTSAASAAPHKPARKSTAKAPIADSQSVAAHVAQEPVVDGPPLEHESLSSAPIPAARVLKRRGRAAAPEAAQPNLAHVLAGVPDALETRPAQPTAIAGDAGHAGDVDHATVISATGELPNSETKPELHLASASTAMTSDSHGNNHRGGNDSSTDSIQQAIPPSFEETLMPIALEDRTVKLAVWLLALTAGFGFITMVCMIWSLYILTHPPLEVPAANPLASVTTSSDQALASAVAALTPAASSPAASASPAATTATASAPAAVHRHHHHKPKISTAA